MTVWQVDWLSGWQMLLSCFTSTDKIWTLVHLHNQHKEFLHNLSKNPLRMKYLFESFCQFFLFRKFLHDIKIKINHA